MAGSTGHAGVAAKAHQRRKLERLCRYIARLAALVPKPRVNLTRFHGVFAPNSRLRQPVTPARRGKRTPLEAKIPAQRRVAMAGFCSCKTGIHAIHGNNLGAAPLLADPDKLVRRGDSQACDLLAVEHYMQAAVSSLLDAVRRGDDESTQELPVIPQGASGCGSTLYVDFYSTRPVYRVEKCHLNAMVADTGKWEQSAAFALDAHPGVDRWVKK